MKKFLAALALLASCLPALAQTGSSQSLTAITNDINTNWTDNATGAITPRVARQTLLNIINSYPNFISTYTIPSLGASTGAFLRGDVSGGQLTPTWSNTLVGVLSLQSGNGNIVSVSPGSPTSSWVFTLPPAAPAANGQLLVAVGTSGATAWAPSGANVPAPIGTNTFLRGDVTGATWSNQLVGQFVVGQTSSVTGTIAFLNATNAGSQTLKGSVPGGAANLSITLPTAAPSTGQALVSSDTNGTLTWQTIGSGGSGTVPTGGSTANFLQGPSATPNWTNFLNANSSGSPATDGATTVDLRLIAADSTLGTLDMYGYGAAGTPQLQFNHPGGTGASPAATANTLGTLIFRGVSSTGPTVWTTGAVINATPIDNPWTSGTTGTGINFFTTAGGTTGFQQAMALKAGAIISQKVTSDPGAGKLTISANASTTPNSLTGNLLTIGADTANTNHVITSYGTSVFSILSLAASGGTGASPTALPAQRFAAIVGSAYNGSTFATTTRIAYNTLETQSGTTEGSSISFETIPRTTTALTFQGFFDNGLTVGLLDAVPGNGNIILGNPGPGGSGGLIFFQNQTNAFQISLAAPSGAGAPASSFGLTLPPTAGSVGQVLTAQGGGAMAWGSAGAGTVIQNYITGFTIANDAGSLTQNINVSSGFASDSSNTVYLNSSGFPTTPIIKGVGVAWAAGSGNGCLDTGAIASTAVYHIFVIATGGGTTDILCSLSASAPTMPATYITKRRIGSVVRVGGNNLLFTQIGNTFILQSPQRDVNSGGNGIIGTTATSFNLTVPTAVAVKVDGSACLFGASGSATVGNVYTPPPVVPDQAAVYGAFGNLRDPTTTAAGVCNPISVWTNTNGQIRMVGSANAKFDWTTNGWNDTRGQ